MRINTLYQRLDEFMQEVPDAPGVVDVVDTEEYIPPHKQAGFIPYDVVVTFDVDPSEIGEEHVETILEGADVSYDEVLGITESDDPRLDGDAYAYVSLS